MKGFLRALYIFLNRWGPLLALCLLLFCSWFYYHHSTYFSQTSDGFIICRSDCRNYDEFSNYLIQNLKFHPIDNDLHSGVFFRGYVLWITILKLLFGTYWGAFYTFFNALFAFGIGWFGARVLAQKSQQGLLVLIAAIFMVTLKPFLEYQKTLLTDYPFALVNALVFLLIALGLKLQSKKWLIIALAAALCSLFVRSNGLFALCLALGYLISFKILPKLTSSKKFTAFLPIFTGLSAWLIATTLTLHGAEKLKSGHEINSLSQFSQVLVRTNYFGDEYGADGLGFHNRLGTGVVNAPYQSWIYNDGSFLGVATGILKKIPYFFETQIRDSPRLANLYRLIYYTFVYTVFLLSVIFGFLHFKNNPALWVLFMLFCGYLIFTTSITYVTTRYRLVLDVIIILCSATFLSFILEKGTKALTNTPIKTPFLANEK